MLSPNRRAVITNLLRKNQDMRKTVVVTACMAIVAAPVHAGIGAMLKGQIQKVLQQSASESEKATATVQPPLPDPDAEATAPAEPREDRSVTDRFVTRKDIHGHDYDAMTGSLICLAKPRKYKTGKYAMGYNETRVPEGHNPNVGCITADREYREI